MAKNAAVWALLLSCSVALTQNVPPSLQQAGSPTHPSFDATTGTRPAPGSSTLSKAPIETRRIVFSTLSNKPALHLRSTQGQASLDFGTRADELVVKATIRLRYTYSPALIPEQSHIKLLLNGEIIGVLPIEKENAGKPQQRDIELDPRLISGFNKLTLDFVGHYTNECEDHLHTSLWADVSGSSELVLSVQPLLLRNDLAQLPRPFFDAQDLTRVKLPFVFASRPSPATLQAAGVTSSWFGQLAKWRGTRFRAYLNQVPTGHAIVFATNSERPDFIKDMPAFTGPAVTIMPNPADPFAKILLITGRDGNDLVQASNVLVLGHAVMSGERIQITGQRTVAPRQAYDAPNWVRMDRPMRFGELAENREKLQVFGHVTEPILIPVRVPPDLYTGYSAGIPVDFKFRYTPPIRPGESRMSMSMNDELVQGVNLRPSGPGRGALQIAMPSLEKGLLTERRSVVVPAHQIGVRNELGYSFSFTYQKEGACRDTHVENVRAMIDADSTIDFTGFPHYAVMPNLGYFVTAGFPFTKYADLGQTAVILPDVPSAPDIEVLLTLLGRMGESTGYPATRVVVTSSSKAGSVKERDLLLIGTTAKLALLDTWKDQLPAAISGQERRISQPARPSNVWFDRLDLSSGGDGQIAVENMMQGDGSLAAIMGFESPLATGRSIVSITAVQDSHMRQVLDILENEETVRSMHGSAIFVQGERVQSVLAGTTYTLGHVPVWLPFKFWIIQQPVAAAGLAGGSALLLSLLCMRLARKRKAHKAGR